MVSPKSPYPLLLLISLLVASPNHTLQFNFFSGLDFPLISSPLAKDAGGFSAMAVKDQGKNPGPFDYSYKSRFKYSMALIVSLPVGTPPQAQQMVLDTGSQLSWIQCNATSFDPSRSSSFSVLPCNHPVCKPRIPDFTIPTDCDQKRLCHYSYFYADGTHAEGNLVSEKLTLADSKVSPPLVLGCAAAADSSGAQGILGMNLGRLSFVSQAKVRKFSYCVPFGQATDKKTKKDNPEGKFYLGDNPNSRTFKYTKLLTFPESQGKPNFDPNAYTVGLVGIKIGGKQLNIPPAVFRPDAGGSGQTTIDSGTQYTFLVDAAYDKVREEIVKRTGGWMKKGYVFSGSLDMCFDGGEDIGRLIGDMAFDFGKGVEILIDREKVLDDVGGGIRCVGIGRSGTLGGVASNIIGNFHQQDHWVEFDVGTRRVGFGVADCSKAE